MKKSKLIALLGVLGLSLAGGATAAAFVVKGANTTQNITADAAMILEWGASAEVSAVSDLTPGAPALRSFSIAVPKKSSNNALTEKVPTVFFTLAADSFNTAASIDGLSVRVASSPFTNSQLDTDILATLDKDHLTYDKDVSAIAAETTFYLEFTIDQDAFDEYVAAAEANPGAPTKVLAGFLTISYDGKAA